MKRVYLDNAATTRVDSQVFGVMKPYFLEKYGVASSEFGHTQGIEAKEKVKTTEDIVSKRLRHVINPVVGLDVVKTNIVKNIKVDKGKVTITVDIPKDNQFAGNINE